MLTMGSMHNLQELQVTRGLTASAYLHQEEGLSSPNPQPMAAGALLSSLGLAVYWLRVPGYSHTSTSRGMPCSSQFLAQTNITVLMTRPWPACYTGLSLPGFPGRL